MLDDESDMIEEILMLNQNKKSARFLSHIQATFGGSSSDFASEDSVALL